MWLSHARGWGKHRPYGVAAVTPCLPIVIANSLSDPHSNDMTLDFAASEIGRQ
jgi:hypothetical protein